MFSSVNFNLPPASSTLPYRHLAFDLCNREANQDKQVIIFLPTKASCRRFVDDFIHFIDATYPDQPGTLTANREEKVVSQRKAVVDVQISTDVHIETSRATLDRDSFVSVCASRDLLSSCWTDYR